MKASKLNLFTGQIFTLLAFFIVAIMKGQSLILLLFQITVVGNWNTSCQVRCHFFPLKIIDIGIGLFIHIMAK